MRRSNAGGAGEGGNRTTLDAAEGNAVPFRPATGAVVPPEVAASPLPDEDYGVRVVPPMNTPTGVGVWAVAKDGMILAGARFEGRGAEGRANGYAAWVIAEVRAGRFGTKVAHGTCSLGNPCDRDRCHVLKLTDLSPAVLATLVFCAAHRAALAPTPRPAGRRRKAATS